MIGITLAAFAATNLDNLALLIGWIASGSIATWRLLAAFISGMLTLLLIAAALNQLSDWMPIEYIGYLGVIPVILGLVTLAGLLRGHHQGTGETLTASAFAVYSTQLANGMDTVLTFAPLMADSTDRVDLVILTVFVIAATLWFALAWLLGRQVARVNLVIRYGRWFAPVVMILVGVYILADTPTDFMN